jgi:hypothetical protein
VDAFLDVGNDDAVADGLDADDDVRDVLQPMLRCFKK